MKNIAIVGAGQSGLLLAIVLKKHGYNISLYNHETPESIINGNIRSSQAIFNTALDIERKYNLNFWDGICPNNSYLAFFLKSHTQGISDIKWTGCLDKPFQSVDQRLKLFSWIKEYIRIGGRLFIESVNLSDLNTISENNDLTIIASGKGDLRNLFEIDNEKNQFKTPQRNLTLLYVKGMAPSENQGVKINIIPGIGEYFTLPGLSYNGICEMMLFEGIPGSDMSELSKIQSEDQILYNAKSILKKYVHQEYDRCTDIYLSDDKAYLSASITPTIRKPISLLSNGKYVLGIGDCIVLNDPISGQGANTAIRCVEVYLNEIINHHEDFSNSWMQETFDKFWEFAQWPVTWGNMLLRKPEQHILSLLAHAQTSKNLANTIANGFDNIDKFLPMITSENLTNMLIGENK